MALENQSWVDKRRGKQSGKPSTSGKFFLLLFGLPFAAAGVVFFMFLVYPELEDWIRAKSWQPVQATVLSAHLNTNSSSDSTTYEASGEYSYRYLGNDYTGNRVALSTGADNIGNFQQNLAGRMEQAQRSGSAITVYVNPENPSESIVNREMRWGLMSMKLIFAVIFSAFGFGIIIYAIASSDKSTVGPMAAVDRQSASLDPAAIKKEWVSPVIMSGAKTMMFVMWGVAIFWNLISAPLLFAIPDEVEKGEWGILIGLVFNVIGIGLVVYAIRKTLEWRRFGPTPLTMDPHPGAIGGNVGGTIDVRFPYSTDNRFKLTLSNVRSYVTGSGKNRSRSETINWQDSKLARNEPGRNGTRISFRFDVPAGLRASEKHSSDYYKWYLELKADLPGVDLERRFEIPVFDTGEKSRFVGESFGLNEGRNAVENDIVNDPDLPAQVSLNQGGLELYFPMGRAKSMAVMLILAGGIFSGAGVFMGYEYLSGSDSDFMIGVMALVFFAVGLMIELGGLYTLINSLWVRIDALGVRVKRCLFGIAVFQRGAMKEDISGFSTRKGAQSGSTVYYSIFANTRGGRSIKVGESFVGQSSANSMLTKMKRYLDI